MPDVDTVSQRREINEEENVLPIKTPLSEQQQHHHHRATTTTFSYAASSNNMPAKVMDQTMTTLSLSMEDDLEDEIIKQADECTTTATCEQQERMVLAAVSASSSRFVVWKDDCEPPSPIRRLVTTQQAPDRVVVLNTRHSLLGEESDTEGEEEEDNDDNIEGASLAALDENENEAEQDSFDQEYNDHLTKLNFRLEMEEHARLAINDVFLLPDIPEAEVAPFGTTTTTPVRVSPSQSDQEQSPEKVTTVSTQQMSMLESMTVGFVDTLCMPRKVCGTKNPTLPTSTTVEYESSLQQGFLQVLGCSSPPDDDEIAQLWDMETTLQLSCSLQPSESPRRLTYSPPVPEPPTGPHRPGPRERIMRLRKWRRERSLMVVPDFPERTRSIDMGKPMEESLWNHQTNIHNINGDDDDGDADGLTYDSDPEMSVSMRSRKANKKKVALPPPPPPPSCPTTPKRSRSRTFRWMVRESMNQHWELKWHTEKASKSVRAWMERGTIVGGQMLEPALVLRHGAECTQLRFLNICRILPATPNEQIRASILARPSCTLRIMTSGGEEFFLEAASAAMRNEIVDTWKLCVARFATLAVLEDVDSIQREFFHASCHSYVPDVDEVISDLERDAKLDD